MQLKEKEIRRFEGLISELKLSSEDKGFFLGDTVDGRSYAINLQMIQAAHVLMEPSHPEDYKFYEGPIRILLKGRPEAIETHTEDPDQLYALYDTLQAGPPMTPQFVDYTDEDFEQLYINVSELIYIEAPTRLLDKGYKMIMDDMNSKSL